MALMALKLELQMQLALAWQPHIKKAQISLS